MRYYVLAHKCVKTLLVEDLDIRKKKTNFACYKIFFFFFFCSV